MNVVFLTLLDPKEINSWSGTLYHIYHRLKEKHRVEIIGTEIMTQLAAFVRGNLTANTFVPLDRYVKSIGRLISERINLLGYDLIFYGDLLLHPLDIKIPAIHFSDMICEKNKLDYAKLDKRNKVPCINLEKLSLNTAFKIIYSSEWVKNRAVEVYHINPAKIEVIEFGANIPTPSNYSITMNMDVCRLVFIGKDRVRKGGDKLPEIYKTLKEDGFPCALTIIGFVPEEGLVEDKDLTVIPHLDKAKKEDLAKLCAILSESHFLVLPTRFDAFGIVFCEASAYGLPSISADVGGVSQAIREGKNGFLLPADASAKDYAEKIKTVFSDKENYFKLRQSSRHEFETRLNWDVWGEKVNKILEEAVGEWKQL